MSGLPCLAQPCPNYATYKGRCADHQLEGYKSFRKERLPKDWSYRRNAVFHRDSEYCNEHRRKEAFCYICGKCGATEIDHIEAGDDHDFENLAAICHTCHLQKTSQEGNQARRDQRVKQWGETWAEEYWNRENGN